MQGPGQPGLPTRLMARVVHSQAHTQPVGRGAVRSSAADPYYQFFCGELSFCHKLPFDRSSLTHWRQRLGKAQLVALIQEKPVGGAQDRGAGDARPERVVVDTTVQPKAIAHPTDARLCHRALARLVALAKRNDVPLRQS